MRTIFFVLFHWRFIAFRKCSGNKTCQLFTRLKLTLVSSFVKQIKYSVTAGSPNRRLRAQRIPLVYPSADEIISQNSYTGTMTWIFSLSEWCFTYYVLVSSVMLARDTCLRTDQIARSFFDFFRGLTPFASGILYILTDDPFNIYSS